MQFDKAVVAMQGEAARLEALRVLPQHRRASIFAALERGDGRMSPAKARRQIEIVRRHILDGEQRRTLCREFGISPAQFFADRRDGLQRTFAAVAALHVRSDSHHALATQSGDHRIAHAMALHEAGESAKAARLLDFEDSALSPADELDRVTLGCELGADLGYEHPKAAVERLHHLKSRASDAGRPFIDAALAVQATYVAVSTGDPRASKAAFEQARDSLQTCAQSVPRVAVTAARFSVMLAPTLQELGSGASMHDVLDESLKFAAAHCDVPISIRALAHAHRACLYSATPHMLARATVERETALRFALANALPRTMWVCLYLSVFEQLWRDDPPGALADAHQLFTSVETSESRAWHRIARSRLSNALSAVERIDDAQRAIAPLGEDDPYDPVFVLQSCALAFRRAAYAETAARATDVVANFGHQGPHFVGNALMFRAGAAYHLHDYRRARADIGDAVDMFEHSGGTALFLQLRAFRLAYQITGSARYNRAALELGHAFEAAERSGNPPTGAPVLTPRQREIARLAANGATNPAIAQALGISTRTVGNHLASVFASLGIRARWQLPSAVAALDPSAAQS